MTRRWRLFPKYALLIITLVGSMLIASGAIGLYFSWRETEAHLVDLQNEKAQNAAVRIELFISDIEQQLSWTALPRADADGDAIEQRRIDYLKLQRQAPAITEVVWIDPKGREQLRISRLAMDVIGSGVDVSQEERFRVASAGRTYYGPVYFRKGTEPYMTIARPAGSGGGVTAAEVNLKFVLDVVSRIRIGVNGLAYVVDDSTGTLIAHPDISLVLKKFDLSALPQVAALRSSGAGAERVLARDLKGQEVLSAKAEIPKLHWTVFVESPRAEAFAPLYATLQRTSLILVVALLISIAASFFLARALVRPLRALQEGAAQIGAGDLDRHIVVRTGDELEGLAEQFNRMSAELRESYAGLERKVEQRTAELSEALEQQTATAEILRVISGSVADSRPVFEKILESCAHLFSSSEQGILLVGDDDRVYLASHRGHARERLAPLFPSNQAPGASQTIFGGEVMHFRDVLADPDVPPGIRAVAEQIGTGTFSQLFAPLVWEGRGIGSLYVIRQPPTGFSDKEIALLKTFAAQAVIAIQNARLFNETKEALEQQTATAAVLQVISSSVADAKPVFDAILLSCERLFGGRRVAITILGDDGLVHLGAYRGPMPDEFAKSFPVPLTLESGTGSAILSHRVLQYPDVLGADKVPEYVRRGAATIGTRSMVIAPLLWQESGIGALMMGRSEPGEFSDKDIALMKTFADQAVIAIQNARLFNETKEALEQQTATAEVLRVISSSVADTRPVFDKILDSCRQLFAGSGMLITLVGDDGMVHLAAYNGNRPEQVKRFYPAPLSGGTTEIAFRARSVLHYPDSLGGDDLPASLRELSKSLGFNFSLMIAPMLWEGRGIGAIHVTRAPPQPFSDKERNLLQTFADQATIAIQNAHLFNETKEALEQQTATAEVLQVISSSVADTRPVFDKILDSCERLFAANALGIFLVDDAGLLHLGGFRGESFAPSGVIREVAGAFPRPVSGTSIEVALRDRRVVHFPDVLGDPNAPPPLRRIAEATGNLSVAFAPMLLEGRGVGAIQVSREPPAPFSAKELALLKTFADQAVIAIQNARLFNETREALEQQKASSEVLNVISSSVADTQPVFDSILSSCERLFGGTHVVIDRLGEDRAWHLAAYAGPRREEMARLYPTPLGNAPGIDAEIMRRRVTHFPDVASANNVAENVRRGAELIGCKTLAMAPMLTESRRIGTIIVGRDGQPFTAKEMALLQTFADQAVIAIQNAHLFDEIQTKSRELEMANKHKSEFLANMSHELRTPLNAIIGFSEVLSERMFGEVNEKQLEYLRDIHSSGHHLLSLINDILDLSKIEAGRMELDLATTNLPMLLDNCTTLVRERASRSGLVLALEVEDGVGDWVADVRKLKQVVINLLANAVKFTPAGGRVTLRARKLEHVVEIAVIDTGVGIAKDQQVLVFEEFRQAGGDYLRKSEGTGLGLSLARRFVELHGGSIRVESEPGSGATFAFILPERVVEAVA
ncbi:MAG TPA: GAF domain-containing protein [Caldimonas sp.]